MGVGALTTRTHPSLTQHNDESQRGFTPTIPSTHKSQSKSTPQQIHVISPFAPERLIRIVRFDIVTLMLT